MTHYSTIILKICKTCGITKPESEFEKRLKTCKHCMDIIRETRSQEYYQKHRDDPEFKAKRSAAHKRRSSENREMYLKQKHETYLRNKEWYNANWHARRAIAAGASTVDRSITISKLLEIDNYTCGICGFLIKKDAKRHSDKPSIDHIIPIKRGGQHIWENVRAVHCGCNNSRKNQKDGTYKVRTHFLQIADNSEIQKLAYQLRLFDSDFLSLDFAPNEINTVLGCWRPYKQPSGFGWCP